MTKLQTWREDAGRVVVTRLRVAVSTLTSVATNSVEASLTANLVGPLALVLVCNHKFCESSSVLITPLKLRKS